MKQIKILLAGFAAMAILSFRVRMTLNLPMPIPMNLMEINPEYLFNTSSYYTLNAFCGSMKKVLLANYSHYYGELPWTGTTVWKSSQPRFILEECI